MKDIIIIGAGFAGLRCAHELQKLNYNVTVFEARSRVGGRVHTVQQEGRLIEKGGELIGSNHHDFLDMVAQYNLHLDPICEDNDEIPIVFNGKVITGEESKDLITRTDKVIQRIETESEKIEHPSEPWKNNIELDKISFADILNTWHLDPDVYAFIELLFTRDNVASLEQQSWLSILCQFKAGGPHFWENVEIYTIREGNQSLAIHMASNLNVLIEHEVIAIHTHHDKNEVYVRHRNDIVMYLCDFVVLAVPMPLISQIEILPNLNLEEYIMPTGNAMKFLMAMDNTLPVSCHSCDFGELWEPPHFPYNENYKYDRLFEKDYNMPLYRNIFTGGDTNCKIFQDNPMNYLKMLKPIHKDSGKMVGHLVNWGNEKYTRTGYSYGGIGTVTILKNLNELILSNNLAFTGEACSPDFPGFMNGALKNGRDTAMRIDRFFK